MPTTTTVTMNLPIPIRYSITSRCHSPFSVVSMFFVFILKVQFLAKLTLCCDIPSCAKQGCGGWMGL